MNNVRKYIYDYLAAHPCVSCGEHNVCCLSFHHRKPAEKKFNISQARRFKHITITEIRAEIRKCDVLCLNCHAKKTAEEQNWYKHIKITNNGI